MRTLIIGYWISQLVQVAAKLGLADKIGKGSKSVAELSTEVGAKPEALARVLRALASVGVFKETKGGRFAATPLSDTLRSDAPMSMRPFALMMIDDYNWLPWGALNHGVKNGGVPFEATHGMKTFDWFDRHPDQAKTFGEAMTSISGVENPAVANAYDFSRFSKLVDVGGSQGHLLAAILRKHKKLRGVLFDQPSVIERASSAGHVGAKDAKDRY